MQTHTAIPLPIAAIAALCRKFEVRRLSLFGSILTEDFTAQSDVDFLVEFERPTELGPWMSRLTDLAEELSAAVGRPVDICRPDWLKPLIRDRVIASSEVIYESA